MQQIFIIHGGDSFSSYEAYLDDLRNKTVDYDRLKPSAKWRDTIVDNIPEADLLTPTMPNSANAQFEEWKIYFEKLIPFFGNDVRLIGHSLGAMFLAKYLHQNPLAHPVKQIHLLAGGYNDASQEYGSFAVESAAGLEKSADQIHLYHSRDDFVVPFSELAHYIADLPMAHVHEFVDRNHFLDPEFPELIELLKQK